jgi:CHAD domain-containing protein
MPYRIRRGHPVVEEVRRIVNDELDGALEDVDAAAKRRSRGAVHGVRKRVKRVRAVLRLARGGLPRKTFAREDHALRDAARELAAARDVDARIEAARKLLMHERYGLTLDPYLDDRLQVHFGEARDVQPVLASFADQIRAVRHRVPEWLLQDRGFGLLEKGLGGTYRRAQRTMARAEKRTTGSNLHEWRKLVKYHGHHCQHLFNIWAPVMQTRFEEVDGLAESLGDEHDLELLRDTLRRHPDVFGGAQSAAYIRSVVKARREEIRAEAFQRGRLLFVEPGRQHVRRVRAYWNIWRQP